MEVDRREPAVERGDEGNFDEGGGCDGVCGVKKEEMEEVGSGWVTGRVEVAPGWPPGAGGWWWSLVT